MPGHEDRRRGQPTVSGDASPADEAGLLEAAARLEVVVEEEAGALRVPAQADAAAPGEVRPRAMEARQHPRGCPLLQRRHGDHVQRGIGAGRLEEHQVWLPEEPLQLGVPDGRPGCSLQGVLASAADGCRDQEGADEAKHAAARAPCSAAERCSPTARAVTTTQ